MKPHYLSVMRPANAPPIVLSVGVSTRVKAVGSGAARRRYLSCQSWTLRAYDLRDKGDKPKFVLSGDEPVTLWSAVRISMEQTGVSWLWTLGLRDLLVLTDWYGLLEKGEWWLGGMDQGSEVEESLKMKRHFRGYLIDSDPPNIVFCQERQTGRMLQMADLRNFGIENWQQLGEHKDVEIAARTEMETGCDVDQAVSNARSLLIGQWAISWSRLVTEQHWGPLRPTSASQAMASYRTKFLKSPILCHDNQAARDLERDSYYAGRNEAYRIGHVSGPIWHLDIQSCYPCVSRAVGMPARLKGYDGSGQGNVASLLSDGWKVIADVTLATHRPDYPCRRGKEVVYPVGRFRTSICGPELEEADNLGIIEQTHRVAWYEESELFTEWTDEMLAIRALLKAGTVHGMLAAVKSMSNNLYGSFAKRNRQWVRCECSPAPGPYSLWYERLPEQHKCSGKVQRPGEGVDGSVRDRERILTRWRSRGWLVEYQTAPEDAPDSLPAISAWVSSLGRARLLVLLNCAGRENVFYTDTDSLWVNKEGYDNLTTAGFVKEGEYGKLKLVGKYDSITIHGHKSYVAGEKGIQCGVPAIAAINPDGTAVWESVECLDSSCRRNSIPTAILSSRKRSRTNKYTGGRLLPNGKVAPLIGGIDF